MRIATVVNMVEKVKMDMILSDQAVYFEVKSLTDRKLCGKICSAWRRSEL